MKNLAFVLIILAALCSPLSVRAQQAVSTASPLPRATATPAYTLLPSLIAESTSIPTVTPILPASPTETNIPTLIGTAIASEIVTLGATADSSMTPEPTLTSTQTWVATVTPVPLATQTPDSALAPTCPTGANGTPVSSLSTPATASLFSRASLDSGLNPALAVAALVDPSGKVIANAPFNPNGTLTLTAVAGDYILRLSAPGYLAEQKPVTLLAGQPIEIAAAILPAGDINADNRINALDLISLGAAYETTLPQPSAADLNGDGHVDLFDLTLLAKNWRKIGPINW
ncbi:MAG: dockerin type I domain-containing protein [Chloroflexi bacterium]|nr:dockerin type I domain-containing protein [Chloroflexota bacterium]